MSLSQNQLFESALALPQDEGADLAFQLLQSLDPPGDEVAPSEFGSELLARIDSCRRGETQTFSLDETRQIIQQRLSEGY
jgi:hypothetical protein